jgi:hypothetical protein
MGEVTGSKPVSPTIYFPNCLNLLGYFSVI